MGKTRIAPNALKIEVESYDINLWRIPDQCVDWLMWVHFGHPYWTVRGVGFSQLGSLRAAKMLYDDRIAALELRRDAGKSFRSFSSGRTTLKQKNIHYMNQQSRLIVLYSRHSSLAGRILPLSFLSHVNKWSVSGRVPTVLLLNLIIWCCLCCLHLILFKTSFIRTSRLK